MRCNELKEELDALRKEMELKQDKLNQLELEHNKKRQTSGEEKKERRKKITELREANTRPKLLDQIRINELEQQIETLMIEKNDIEIQLRSEKAKIEKELTVTNERLVEDLKGRLVKAVRRKEQLRKANKDSTQLIEELQKKNEKLVTKNKNLLSKIKTEIHETGECDRLKAERDELCLEIKRLNKEADESQLKCKTLEEEIIKCRYVVSRKYKLCRFVKVSHKSLS